MFCFLCRLANSSASSGGQSKQEALYSYLSLSLYTFSCLRFEGIKCSSTDHSEVVGLLFLANHCLGDEGSQHDRGAPAAHGKYAKKWDSDNRGRSREERGMFWLHFKALVAKRATYGMRDKKSLFFQLIVPTLLFLLGLFLLRSG